MNAKQNISRPTQGVIISDPPLAQALFGRTNWAWVWGIPRLYVGWEWLISGWGKINNPAWVGSKAGAALAGFVTNALTKATGAHPDVQNAYAAFLQQAVLPNTAVWSYVVAFGEILVGIGLILGILTGIVAFFGIFMNLNYLMSGTVSVNPILLVISIFLLLAWKTAGWWGLDRWVLPALRTPWSPGHVFQKGTSE